MKSINIGICGMGTVGSGTFNTLQHNCHEISRRTGHNLVVTQVAQRRQNPSCDTSNVAVTNDIFAVANNPEIDIVIELIGGHEPAKSLILTAIRNGKHVVTANKALIAEYGNEIFAEATEYNVTVAYEAAVAGGIPIIKALREGLAANQIQWLAGIINGTGNFILTEMRDKGRDFADVLAEAQALGYAEADPTFDVEGIDAAHKLTILASIAYGIPLQFDACYTEGISQVSQADVKNADALGYRIKHLGISRRTDKGIELRVHPTLIPKKRLIANVNGVMNAVLVSGDTVGPTLYYGPGAGAEPTASAVVADVIDIVRNAAQSQRVPSLGFAHAQITPTAILPISEIESAYYLRLLATDKPGVLAQVTDILGSRGISIEAIQQHAQQANQLPVVILTHHVSESAMDQAIAAIEELADINGEITRIRVENLAG